MNIELWLMKIHYLKKKKYLGLLADLARANTSTKKDFYIWLKSVCRNGLKNRYNTTDCKNNWFSEVSASIPPIVKIIDFRRFQPLKISPQGWGPAIAHMIYFSLVLNKCRHHWTHNHFLAHSMPYHYTTKSLVSSSTTLSIYYTNIHESCNQYFNL